MDVVEQMHEIASSIFDYLFRTSGNYWDIRLVLDISGFKNLNNEFWAKIIFETFEQSFKKPERLILSKLQWIEDTTNFEISSDDDFLITNDGKKYEIRADKIIGKYFGVNLFVDKTLPKHLAIMCSSIVDMKAVVLINNDWKVTPKISKFQWIQNQIEKEELKEI